MSDPHPVDLHVGARLRLRRAGLGMSQDALARALGVSFQQVQKYETGANRLSASRLHAASRTLAAPVAWFFEGLPGDGMTDDAPANDVPAPPVMAFTSQGLELAALVSEIPESQVRRRLLQLVRTLAEAARLARELREG